MKVHAEVTVDIGDVVYRAAQENEYDGVWEFEKAAKDALKRLSLYIFPGCDEI